MHGRNREVDRWATKIAGRRTTHRVRPLLEAALDALGENDLTVSSVARRAGVGGATVHRYFEGAGELIRITNLLSVSNSFYAVSEAIARGADSVTSIDDIRTLIPSIVDAQMQLSTPESVFRALASIEEALAKDEGEWSCGQMLLDAGIPATAALREWQHRWLVNDDADAFVFATAIITMGLAGWLSAFDESEKWASLLIQLLDNLLADHPVRVLADDSWVNGRRTPMLPPIVPHVPDEVDRVLKVEIPEATDRHQLVAMSALDLTLAHPGREFTVAELIDHCGVPVKELYTLFHDKSQIVRIASFGFASATQAAYLDSATNAIRSSHDAKAVERSISDVLQRFADPGSLDNRRIRLRGIRTLVDVTNPTEHLATLVTSRDQLARAIDDGAAAGTLKPTADSTSIANLIAGITTVRAVLDSVSPSIGPASWGWYLDLTFGQLLTGSAESVFRDLAGSRKPRPRR